MTKTLKNANLCKLGVSLHGVYDMCFELYIYKKNTVKSGLRLLDVIIAV